MSDAAMRRARRRRKITHVRYRLATWIGGWMFREDEAELAELRKEARAMLTAQGKMLDRWAEADEAVRRGLWQALHESADRVRDALEGTRP